MSYDLDLTDPVDGTVLTLDNPHQMKGGTYQVGGTSDASLNITYNYSNHYYRTMGEKGIRSIYGLTGLQSIPLLDAAISQLGNDTDPDYWTSTEGNAKRPLIQLKTLATLRPDGIWKGD
jgi:hypothetical protein